MGRGDICFCSSGFEGSSLSFSSGSCRTMTGCGGIGISRCRKRGTAGPIGISSSSCGSKSGCSVRDAVSDSFSGEIDSSSSRKGSSMKTVSSPFVLSSSRTSSSNDRMFCNFSITSRSVLPLFCFPAGVWLLRQGSYRSL